MVIDAAKEVKSMAHLLRKLDLIEAGGNYSHMKKTLQRLNIDCSHWTGQAWNRDQRTKDWSNYTLGRTLKPHIIKERGHKCEQCQLENWLDNLIPLEVHHIDGNNTNNDLNNLALLCPNCHAQTPNYRRWCQKRGSNSQSLTGATV